MITMERMASWMVRRNEGERNTPGCHEAYLLSSWLDLQPKVML